MRISKKTGKESRLGKIMSKYIPRLLEDYNKKIKVFFSIKNLGISIQHERSQKFIENFLKYWIWTGKLNENQLKSCRGYFLA